MAIVLKITKPTFNVLTETNAKNFILDASLNHLRTSSSGSFTRTRPAASSLVVYTAHGLGYKPLAFAYFRSTANSNWFISMTQVESTNSRLGAYFNVELYVDTTNVYFRLNNYHGSNSYTIEVQYEIFFEGS